jgi:hypothetical protein
VKKMVQCVLPTKQQSRNMTQNSILCAAAKVSPMIKCVDLFALDILIIIFTKIYHFYFITVTVTFLVLQIRYSL